MSSISSMDTVRPPRSPSPASSPTLEDDIAHTRTWPTHEGDVPEADRKGKGRQQYADLSEDNANLSDASSYPPQSDQEAETRRIEETLRQWEITERQRRKNVRESGSAGSMTASSSLLTDVTRRASLLWRSGSRKRNPSIGGKHTALGSTDNLDAVPLEDIAASPTPTPSLSPTPSPSIPLTVQGRSTSAEDDNMRSGHNSAENPFETPTTPTVLEALSPFADTHRIDADKLRTPVDRLKTLPPEKRQSRPPPPPMPLNLPRPKTPPLVGVSTPPYPIDSPDATPRSKDDEDDGKAAKWWHEWLCGCGEGPDRGGDYQAGRTNPFE